MVCAPTSTPATANATPHSALAAHLIERNYADLGCNRWGTRRVLELLAKLNDTPQVLAARLRIRMTDFERRMETDCWTKQDGLILTMLEREVDLLKGGFVPSGHLIATGGTS